MDPGAAEVGAMVVMVGAETVKVAPEPVPPGVVTDTVPVEPFPTTAVMLVALATLNDATAMPPKVTAVAPVKLVPVMVIVAPTAAEVGAMLPIVGAALNAVVV